MKTLTLIRHAKSDWGDPLLRDFDRPLNGRGKKDAPAMGRRLAARGFAPELIVTSPARRAMSTAKRIAKAIGYPKERILTDPHIYEADLDTLMAVVNGLDDALERVALIGHNPGFSELAEHLTGAGAGNLPTCGVFSIRFDLSHWQAVWADSGEADFYDYPKNR